ncbi:hypothetical protein C3V36_03395 [Lachnospiraceae bacterium oral taxon 500]|nr:hypothetical protein C3V36_03395 [Lachnospiraceae bacterium oral taxon 500]
MLNTALIGAGGFGYCHLLALEKLISQQKIALKAVCDVNPCFRQELEAKGIAFFTDYRELLSTVPNLDYITISTPIPTHSEIAAACLAYGAHVLLEKPPAILPEEFARLTAAQTASGKSCAINYTMTADLAFLKLVQLLKNGELGRIHSITGTGLYKRYQSYYSGSPWLGQISYKDYPLRDGTINNPLSHLLNNMLLLAAASGSGRPVSAEAELYRVYPITGEDTSCLRILTEAGTRLLFYATLCSPEQTPARIEISGSQGNAVWQYPGYLQTDAGQDSYPAEENPTDKIHDNMCQFLLNGTPLFCPLSSCQNTVLVSDAAFASAKEIQTIPDTFIKGYQENGEHGRELIGIQDLVYSAATKQALFSEMSLPWAVSGQKILL